MRKFAILGLVLLLPIQADVQRRAVAGGRVRFPLFKHKMREPAPVANADGGPRAAAEAKFFDRAYPAQDIPANAHDVSRETFEAIEREGGDGDDQGRWKLIGPSVAFAPGLLTYTLQFTAPGTYSLRCLVHPAMTATVKVSP